jgi:hypothetical protein
MTDSNREPLLTMEDSHAVGLSEEVGFPPYFRLLYADRALV